MFVSLGADGMLAADGRETIRLPRVPGRVLNTTGAGDAVTAALCWAGVHGLSLERSLRFALKAGAITCECVEANNPALAALSGQWPLVTASR